MEAMVSYLKDRQSMFLAGDYPTLADLRLIDMVEHVRLNAEDVWDDLPLLHEHYDRVCKTLPAVGDWIKNRPKTDI